MTLSKIRNLPVEVIQCLLSSIPDISSLISTALTCSSFYHSFKDAETLIAASVLLNQIDIDVLPEAVITLESSRIVPPTKETVAPFVRNHLRYRKIPDQRWTVKDALQMSEFHKGVEFFALAFTKHALERTNSWYPPSRTEINRVERALYRFEIYRNLFAGSWIYTPDVTTRIWSYNEAPYRADQVKAVFFDNFSCWENEQLGCIHDYLCWILIPVYNELVIHDVIFGASLLKFASSPKDLNIQHILGFGLSMLYDLMKAPKPEDRTKVISSVRSPTGYHGDFLWRGLRATNIVLSPAGPTSINPAFFPDKEGGPLDAWMQEHGQQLWASYNTSAHYVQLREWGYVMWDVQRLNEIEIKPPIVRYPSQLGICIAEKDLVVTWRRRSDIYLAGGRGWWSREDESKVVWKEGDRSPYDNARKRKECPFCIDYVVCAPHRLKLRIPDVTNAKPAGKDRSSSSVSSYLSRLYKGNK